MKKMIFKRLIYIFFIVVILSICSNLIIDILNSQSQMVQDSKTLFSQIEVILSENQAELEAIEASYRETCLSNAEAVAYIIEQNPDILDDINELAKIADFMEIDEIHIFDTTGTIVNGTEPKYYGYTFDSGEQIAFFAPMLEDKSLRLCQDIVPNTAEGKDMQYAAVWSENGEMIVQIGNEPTRVLEVTNKNELSYIFSLLTTNEGDTLYAADKNTRTILGSTDSDAIGKTLSDTGFDEYYISTDKDGFHDVINNADVFCVFTEMDDIVIGRTRTTSAMYGDIPKNIFTISLFTLLIAVFLVITVSQYLNLHIVQGISDVNDKLKEITDGNLDERVNVHSTPEFVELSEHINTMIASVLSSTNKISHILDRAQLPMGVYEYNKKMTGVRVTKQLPAILGLNESESAALFTDYKQFEKQLNELQHFPLETFENTYILCNGENLRYIRMERFTEGHSVLGILIDETENILEYQKLEAERDTDILTGLFNRKGLDVRIDKLLETPEIIRHGAVIMLDADGLKTINDKYGHTSGDRYLCEIANAIKETCPENSILSRQGGDEFVLFIYGYESSDELMSHIENLTALSDHRTFTTEDGITITLKYSLGHVMYDSSYTDFSQLLAKADEIMYTNKRLRKKEL